MKFTREELAQLQSSLQCMLNNRDAANPEQTRRLMQRIQTTLLNDEPMLGQQACNIRQAMTYCDADTPVAVKFQNEYYPVLRSWCEDAGQNSKRLIIELYSKPFGGK